MASNNYPLKNSARRDSVESQKGKMWEKTYESNPSSRQDAPFATYDSDEVPEESPDIYQEEGDSNNDSNPFFTLDTPSSRPLSATRHMSNSLLALNEIQKEKKPWEQLTTEERVIIISHEGDNVEKIKKKLSCPPDEEKTRPWHFGLIATHLKFSSPRTIDLRTLITAASPLPYWLTLKNERTVITNSSPVNAGQRYCFNSQTRVSLRFGTLSNLNEFYYSPPHSWTNEQWSQCSVAIQNRYKGNEKIEWIFDTAPPLQTKKELLAANVNSCVIVNLLPDGFDMYICQKCNMNEFEMKKVEEKRDASANREGNRNSRCSGPAINPQRRHASCSRPYRPAPLIAIKSQTQQPYKGRYQFERASRPLGSYFSDVQFSLRYGSSSSNNRFDQPQVKSRIQSTLSSLITFFLSQNIVVCYGNITDHQGPDPCLFLRVDRPIFPSLLMNYAWEMLSIVGYRLQIRIDPAFIPKMRQLSEEPYNTDEVFYMTCVYLSRIFSYKPFADVYSELIQAIAALKQKKEQSAYGLTSSFESDDQNWAYVPSVTLTPTTIRIKPLKYCRTNRVLRAKRPDDGTKLLFGKSIGSFLLVDIRDESGRPLPSYHFRGIRLQLLKYLKEGFGLMGSDRMFKYLHHSQSQLRERQFWFYHHYDGSDTKARNLSFPAAYEWMGNFSKETNPAKYAARIALCFSSTRASVEVSAERVQKISDIQAPNSDLLFTDGCGTMSVKLRDEIKKALNVRQDFSAVQFRYAGAKGVVSVDSRLNKGKDLCLRKSMIKFESSHTAFEVCKLSAPRSLHLNRQAILLLSFRQIPDVTFLELQQRNHLTLIRYLLRNKDAEKVILEKIPKWLLPPNIQRAKIDYIHEPFFRQIVINSCLHSMRDLLRKTRIRVPVNEGRNMFGIIDEYNVLKEGEVFVQYTVLADDQETDDDDDAYDDGKRKQRTQILNDRHVVITKNPCHHPGDVRTFIAKNYPELRHLKDVLVFSQQGDQPASHDISGSDLDGDEYIVIWHNDLVPLHTDNAPPYSYDSEQRPTRSPGPIDRDLINKTILDIAELDCLGRLSNIHLAYADKYGVDSQTQPKPGVRSTVELAIAISQEVDSPKTGYHPVNADGLKKLEEPLGKERPDFVDKAGYEPRRSEHVLGKLFRASKGTLRGWNRLLRYHRHLRHLQIRTSDDIDEEEDDAAQNDDQDTKIHADPSFLGGVDREHSQFHIHELFATQLLSVYRQEMLEILNLYGISHESDVWCGNSINASSGEFEDTALSEVEKLVTRTRTRLFNHHVHYCDTGRCAMDTGYSDLCNACRKIQQVVAVAIYGLCYDGSNMVPHSALILSLPWLFVAPLLQDRLTKNITSTSEPLLCSAMKNAVAFYHSRDKFRMENSTLSFKQPETPRIVDVNTDMELCIFVEIVRQHLYRRHEPHLSLVLSRFARQSISRRQRTELDAPGIEWQLDFSARRIPPKDRYESILESIEMTEETDALMHRYFDDLLQICFDEGRRTDSLDYLNIGESIILLLQNLAIDKTIS